MALTGGTFIGVPFGRQQTDGPTLIYLASEYNYSVTDVAGGDTTILQIGGLKGQVVTESIVVADADVDTMIGKKGQSGTLVLHGRTYRATMVGYGSFGRRPGGYSTIPITWVVA